MRKKKERKKSKTEVSQKVKKDGGEWGEREDIQAKRSS